MKPFRMSVLVIVAYFMFIAADVYAQETVSLPKPKIRGQVMKAFKNRTSIKGFKQKELSDQVLSGLLWAAFGVADPKTGRRTASSAFNVQEIDIYVVKSDGAFRYDAQEHSLIKVSSRDIMDLIASQNYSKSAPLHLVYVADYEKADAVYPRSFAQNKDRWAMMHTGFICQNVFLYCTVNKMSTVVRSFGNRDTLRKELQLRDAQEIIITQAVGYSPK